MSLALVREESLPTGATAFQAVAALRDDLSNSTDVAKGDAMVAVKQPFGRAVARTQHQKNAEAVSVADFGARGDGANDDTAATPAADAPF